ncbi:restriction endonuclease subunit S [Anaerorhabdus sp.]|uniref:restriction endonuclease subunit S n=1 Tax=Anaerorhabdus sp. TaxID=1872524 RepID=UPI002FC7E854
MTENMKPSGIAWIGDIPESWDIKRVKYLASLKGRIGWQGLTSDEYLDEGPYLITGIDFKNGKVDWNSCVHVSKERWEEAREIQIENGDLLITKDGTVGKVAVISDLDDLASLNSGVLVIRTKPDFDRKFLYWVLLSEEFWTWFRLKNAGNSTIIHLYQNDFAEFTYTFPNYSEQTQIANFLDKQCEKINSVATDIEKQIELLQKYKESLITETVTKGLDKTVAMKDSCIEWIGDIPQHWEVKRIKHCCSNVGSGTTPESSNFDFYDGEINWIQSGDLYGINTIEQTEKSITDLALKTYSTLKVYRADYVVVAMYGASVGNVAIAKINACVNQACCVLEATPQSDVRYLYYWLSHCKEDLIQQSFGGGQPNISQQKIKNEPMLSLPFDEQTQIANYLDKKCSKIDSIIESKKEQLEKITQHKKSLIYEYVTGKKRVKGANFNGN